MESIISTFNIDWKIIIAQVVNFAVVFVVLYIYALKPLSKLMKERSEKIAKGLDDAKVNAATLEKSQKEYEEIIAKARKEAQEIFQTGKKEAEAKKAQMLDDAKGEVASMIESGKKSLETEKSKMVTEAKDEVAALIIQATEKILGEKADPKTQAAVKEFSKI